MLGFLRGNKSKQASTKKIDDGFEPVLHTDKLLSFQSGKIAEIKSIISVSDVYWDDLYLQAIKNTASLVQSLPASEYHHHSHYGGLLEHCLDVVLRAIKYRQGKLLPIGCTPEEATQQSQSWTYAIFCSALLHDIGKPLSDQIVSLKMPGQSRTSTWNPVLGSMDTTGATGYQFKYVRDKQGKRNYRLHELVSPLFINTIIPKKGLAWISENAFLFETFLASVYGTQIEDNPIYEIVKRADQDSVAADLNGMESTEKSTARIKSLPERVGLKLRQLIDDESLKINEFGCQGWIKDGFAYMVTKPTLDGIRDAMLAEKQTGIPTHNIRLMSELQGAGYISSQNVGEKHVATFVISITHDDWPKSLDKLKVIRFPLSRIWGTDSKPSEFTGQIQIHNEVPEAKTSEAEDESTDTPQTKPEPTEDSQNEEPNDSVSNTEKPSQDEPAADTAEKTQVSDTGEKTTTEEPEPTKTETPRNVEGLDPKLQKSYPNSPGKQMAVEFLAWLSKSIDEKSILYNDKSALVHIVPEGVLIVSPKIFKEYGKEQWSLLQKGLNGLRLTARTEEGKNIFEYTIGGKNKIRGMLIKDVDNVLGKIKLPKNNVLLKLNK